MRLRLEPGDLADRHRSGVVHGPLVMAQGGRYHRALQLGGGEDLNSRVTAADQPLSFTVRDDVKRDLTSGSLRPLYAFPEGMPYRVYHDLQTPFIY